MYHVYSPLGRGFGVHSSGQLLQIDYIKTQIDDKFDYTKIIDSNNFVNPQKLKQYANGCGIDPDILHSIAFPLPNLPKK
jgi:hypothetical protein